jgi:hypothetical protein
MIEFNPLNLSFIIIIIILYSKFSTCRIHKEQIEKWQDEIKELRLVDTSNEEANAVLHNARYLLGNAHIDS